jgi:DNA-binding SARP family transcriptional activator/predicted ATPase
LNLLSIHLLGPLQITLEGQPVSGFASNKVRALLALLAVEPERPHRRETLAGMLWPGFPERSARVNLRHALANLRTAIADREASPPHLRITRQTIQFNAAGDAWVDVAAFLTLLEADSPTAQPTSQQLAEAVGLYRGEFLAGFSLADSSEFEEWVLVIRERLHRLVMDALRRLTSHYEAEREYERALHYAWRRVDLDPWREEAQRQVMRLLALSGQRGAALAQYENCRRALAQEMGVEPAPETTRLYEQIRDGRLDAPAGLLASPAGREIEHPALPKKEQPTRRPVFVARERELAQLDVCLADALAGQGQVVFVRGGPGRGKTALLAEFARRAMTAHPDLLAAGGACNTLSGVGDPYLPFREIVGALTGDLETPWTAGSLSRDHALRLWSALPLAVQALLEHGPYVTGILVRGPALLSRAAAAAPSDDAPWLSRLREHIGRQRVGAERLGSGDFFEQVTRVLRRLAESRPLLLILDDLQWVDAASTGLLFHLGRRLGGSRILIAGAYRPEEVALGLGGERHPLEKVLAELQVQSGKVGVDLTQDNEVEGRAFTAAFLDTEPNRLGPGFCSALFQRTAGHPLFTVELLRAMQQRGDLVRDEDGRWIEGATLHWDELPARVEGVIGERIGRLEAELRDILAVASVEGDEFTAQVVARVQGTGERQMLRLLAEELGARRRLVQAEGEARIGQQHLARYRFSHVLFREYLYGGLDPGRRRLLHWEVGAALESFYQERTGEIAVQLATHFGGDPEREQRYSRLAGEQAAAQFANQEAGYYLSRALALTPDDWLTERYDLLLAREKVYAWQGKRKEQEQDLEALQGVARALADPQKRAEVTLRQAGLAEARSDYRAAIAASKAALDLLPAGQHPGSEAFAYLQWARALWHLCEYEAARRQLETAVALAREAESAWLEAESLRNLGIVHSFLGDLDLATACGGESLSVFRALGDRQGERAARTSLGSFFSRRSEYQQAKDLWEAALRISRQVGHLWGEATVHGNLSAVLYACGDCQRAADHLAQGLRIARQVGSRNLEGRFLGSLGRVAQARNENARALQYLEQALATAQEVGNRHLETYTWLSLGQVLEELGRLGEANVAYRQAHDGWLEIGPQALTMVALAGLARVSLAQDDRRRALEQVETILCYLESGSLQGTYDPFLVYLTCYRVLHANDDPRAEAVLDRAYHWLQEVAAGFQDEDLQRSFLEKVAAHRDIVSEYEKGLK